MGGDVGGSTAGEHPSPLVRYSAVLLLVSAVGGFASVAVSHTRGVPIDTISPTRPTEAVVILEASGMGALKLGAPFAATVAQAGLRVLADDGLCARAVDPATGATVVATVGLVETIAIQDPGVQTTAGVRVGTAQEVVERTYGRSADAGLVVLPEGANELVLGLYGGEVTFMWARRANASVGC